MPRYAVGRWSVDVADDGTVQAFESDVLRETLDPAAFEARGESRPSYVPGNQATVFISIIRRALYLIQGRRAGVREWVG